MFKKLSKISSGEEIILSIGTEYVLPTEIFTGYCFLYCGDQ